MAVVPYRIMDTCQEHTGMGPNYLATQVITKNTQEWGPNYLSNKALPCKNTQEWDPIT